jgi:hypothetical protein
VDFSAGVAPLDFATARTGNRFCMANCGGVLIVIFKGAGAASEDQTYTLQEHTAYTGGTSATLAIITKLYHKTEAASLDGDEAWTTVTQAAGGTFLIDASELEEIIVIDVQASMLSDGYTHVSLNNDGAGSTAQLGCVLYVPYDLKIQRTPSNMPNWLNPGAANA